MRRVIDRSGRSRAFINGSPATSSQLREAGQYLVDIHGQHEHQSLLRAAAQRELLDAFGGLGDVVSATRARYRAWRERRELREAANANSATIAAEREQLEWQVKELDALSFSLEGWRALLAEHAKLSHAASLTECTQYGLQALSEGEAPALSQLNAAIARLKGVLEFDGSLREVLEVLESAGIQVQDAVYTLRHYQEKLDIDPQRLRDVESRIDAVHSACRKYRLESDGIPAALERARARLAELRSSADPEALKRLEEEAREAYLAEAQKLGAGRRRAAKRLSTEVTAAMQTLAMAGGVFEIALDALEEPAAYGVEQIEFRVAPHKSIAPQPLSRIASGGELSRLSLAIQSVASRAAQVPTLVFDEVDAGIGGGVAEIVGRMLKQLGRVHQVMCITHLPQVAAHADQQWQVAKTMTQAKVSSRVVALDAEQRVEEIARMLGGVKVTETTRRHAAEMLNGGERTRE